MKHNLITSLALSTILSATQLAAGSNILTDAPTPISQPAGFVPDAGAADRIRAADRLRTLSQEISAETCLLHNGVLPDQNRSALAHSISEFDGILDALLNGDPSRHIIGAEENPKTIREIKAIMTEWAPVQQIASDVLADPRNASATHAIYAQSQHLLETTSHLLSELEGEYSHPTEVLMSDMMLIEFAGRQAMLTQKITYDTCLVWSGFGNQEQVNELKTICDNFDLIARALHDGMPAAGIATAPTDEIRAALEEVVEDWDDVLAHIEKIAIGGVTDLENIAWIDQVMTKKMRRMEAIIEMYVAYSRRALI
ncbi:MAG: type IV pili methyl-accepting chemotaxis transducer N-terminal domain-containing protein [Litoreibacter sp.]